MTCPCQLAAPRPQSRCSWTCATPWVRSVVRNQKKKGNINKGKTHRSPKASYQSVPRQVSCDMPMPAGSPEAAESLFLDMCDTVGAFLSPKFHQELCIGGSNHAGRCIQIHLTIGLELCRP